MTEYKECPSRPIYTNYKSLHYEPNGSVNVADGWQVRHAGMIAVAEESGMLAVPDSVRRLCQAAVSGRRQAFVRRLRQGAGMLLQARQACVWAVQGADFVLSLALIMGSLLGCGLAVELGKLRQI